MTTRLSRRSVLRGFGTLMALPFLESFSAHGQAAARKKRFIGYMVPNGMNMPRWNLDGSTTAMTQLGQSQALAPVLPGLAGYLTMVNGLSCRHQPPMSSGGHPRGVTGFLTSATCIENGFKLCLNPGVTPQAYSGCAPAGSSLDQVLAQQLVPQTRYRSLELGPSNNDINGGGCGTFPCAYTTNISWRAGDTPVAREVSPRRTFDRLFAGLNPSETAAARQQRLARRTRVLDFVKEDTTAVKRQLGRDDQRRLDQYFTAVAQLEDELIRAPLPQACALGPRPAVDVPDVSDPTTYLRAFTDVMLLALRCDMTRVLTFMAGGGGNSGSYKFTAWLTGKGPGPGGSWSFSAGGPSGIEQVKHHELSHWTGNEGFSGTPPNPAEFHAMKHQAIGLIDQYYLAELRRLLDGMRAIDDGGGLSVLDNSLVYYSSELSDPDAHSTERLPILLCGGASGALAGNRVVDASADGRVANLHIAVAQAFGVSLGRFGNDGDRPLPGVFG